MLAGCAAGTHFNVPNKAERVPQWVLDTEAAVARAEASAGARACPDKVAKAKDLGKKAVEVYWSCRDGEAEKLASEARDTAAAADAMRSHMAQLDSVIVQALATIIRRAEDSAQYPSTSSSQ